MDLNLTTKLKTGPWKLTDLEDVPKNGFKVFSCFHCGGGSSLGYKLSGFDVLGGVEIDKEMSKLYVKNHNPKYEYLMGVQEFKKLDDLPSELYNLDILDGSPPCSSFSKEGNREKDWGKQKKFKEGQAKQVLDDLFFDYIDIAHKLQPKIVVAENVKGLIEGKAKGYVKQIFQRLNHAGYDCQLFLLNACRMGVPQMRERVFFIARRKDLGLPKIKLDFNEKLIPVSTIVDENPKTSGKLTDLQRQIWDWCDKNNEYCGGKACYALFGKRKAFSYKKMQAYRPSLTLTSERDKLMHWDYPRRLSDYEIKMISSFPLDYDFGGKVGYACGMSVPPFMMNRISNQIYEQWLKEG